MSQALLFLNAFTGTICVMFALRSKGYDRTLWLVASGINIVGVFIGLH